MKKVYLKGMSAEEIIGLLKEGKEIKYGNTTVKTKMINGVICDFKNNEEFEIGNSIVSLNIADAYIEEEEKIEINETGFYATEDGRKVYIFYLEDETAYGVIEDEKNICEYHCNGWCYGGHSSNIVSKWEGNENE